MHSIARNVIAKALLRKGTSVILIKQCITLSSETRNVTGTVLNMCVNRELFTGTVTPKQFEAEYVSVRHSIVAIKLTQPQAQCKSS